MKDILDFPLVSVAIVNLDGKEYLGRCLDSIKKLDYPPDRLEIIVVDNGSTDSSVELIESGYSKVRLIKNDRNTGFAAANNQAAEAAKGEYIAFLNNDTRVDSRWLIELLDPVFEDKEVVASGSKVLSMDGKSLDFVGGMINFEGKGFQIDYGLPVEQDRHLQYKFIPFANGGAMLIQRNIFLEAGGFDSDFFAYYEDVDLGWRLWLMGYRIVFVPKSIVYHQHHGTSDRFSQDKLRFLKERNSLFSVFKNYDDRNLARAFSGTLANILNRVFVDLKFDYKKYYDLSGEQSSQEPEVTISGEPLSSLAAARSFFDQLPELVRKRQEVQSKRKRDDRAIFSYFKAQFMPVSADPQYRRNHEDMLRSLGIYKIFEKDIRRKVIIVSGDPVSRSMAGPAIRLLNFARILVEHMDVVLAVPNETGIIDEDFPIMQYRDERTLGSLVSASDVIICNGMMLSRFESIKESGKFIIIDMYDPYNLATLAEYEGKSMKKRLEVYNSLQKTFNEQFYYGDFFICASDRQRDFWLGMLAALGRVNPFAYNIDPSLRRMIDVVPFGLQSHKPIHTEKVIRGVVKGIEDDDFIIIWGGGIYNWFDPLTLINAMDIVSRKRKNIKLYFMGVKHPNPEVKELDMVKKTVERAKKLGLYEKSIFFNFDWVDYDHRHNYLLEADAGIITHPNHIETRFSFRTRILDYMWAGLPIISTEGDYLSDLVRTEGLGLMVPEASPEDLADAILELAGKGELYVSCVDNIERIFKDFTWENVCKPIIDFCQDPVSNALKNNSGSSGSVGYNSKNKSERSLPGRFFYHLTHSGVRNTSRYLINYIRHR